jgi:succinyl-diaminopimelate desuccinylase
MNAIDPVALTKRLIACPSVTPVDAGAMGVIAEALQAIGFTVHRFASGEAPDGPVENLFALRGQGGPHFAFAGHSDVVPAGEGWQTDPFVPEVRGELLYGRGAVDMKGAIAAFIAAAERITDQPGTLSLIITGDEEGAATFGTVKLIDWMRERGICPDLCLVGEPTSANRLGDMVKIGRRGSVNIWIEGPCCLSAPCRQSDPAAGEGAQCAGCAPSRRRQSLVPALQSGNHHHRRRECRDQRHPGGCAGADQHPFQ